VSPALINVGSEARPVRRVAGADACANAVQRTWEGLKKPLFENRAMETGQDATTLTSLRFVSRPKIALIMAMRAEAQPLIDALELDMVPNWFPAAGGSTPYRRNEQRESELGAEILLVHVGQCPRFGVDNIGTQPATLATYFAVSQFRPDLVLSVGTCGGFRRRGANVGDVYLADEAIIFHDRRIDLPGFDRYGLGNYKPARIQHHANGIGAKLAIVSSGNSLDMPPSDHEVMERRGATVKDMEAAAVAWVCEQMSTPMSALKSVTDIVDGEHATSEEFLRNLAFASRRLCDTTLDLLRALASDDPKRWTLFDE
jgi:nucleoside phosphorylase